MIEIAGVALSEVDFKQIVLVLIECLGCGCGIAFALMFIIYRIVCWVDELADDKVKYFACRRALNRIYGKDKYSKDLLKDFYCIKSAFPDYPNDFILEMLMQRNCYFKNCKISIEELMK